MSATSSYLSLADLSKVRILCRRPQCGHAVEIPLDRLGGTAVPERLAACPHCNAPFEPDGSSRRFRAALGQLCASIRQLKARELQNIVAVELVAG
jgi:hypothetical protein